MLLATAAAAVLLAQMFYLRVDREIRQRVEVMLAQAYPHLKVSIRSARLVEGEGIEIRGVSLIDPTLDASHAEILAIEELFLACNTDVKDLLSKDPDVSRIRIRGPQLRVIRQADGRWVHEKLWPPPKKQGSHSAPAVSVEHASIEILDLSKSPPSSLWLRDVQFEVAALDDLAPPVLADFVAERLPPGEARPPGCRRIALRGSFAGDYLHRVEVLGEFDLARQAWACAGRVTGLEACPELAAALPKPAGDPLCVCSGLRARLDLDYRVAHRPGASEPWQFAVECNIAEGRLDDPRLPLPLSDLDGVVIVRNTGVTIERLHAKSGDAQFDLTGRWSCLAATGPGSLHLSAQRVPLERRLTALFPPAAQELWSQYLPQGTVNATFDFTHDGVAWHPHGVIELSGASLSYFKFPYRIEQMNGRVLVKDRLLLVDIVGQAGGEPLKISGNVQNPGPEAQLEVYFDGDRIPCDEKLLRALPDPTGRILRSLHPSGQLKLHARLTRAAGLGQPVEQEIELSLKDGAVNFENFPYPVRKISGVISGFGRVWGAELNKPSQWTWDFRDLAGVNDSGEITCHGGLTPGEKGNELTLHLTGRNVPLDEELRAALRPQEQKVWSDLRPQGTINLASRIHVVTGSPAEVTVDVFPQGATIEPTAFPYRLEKLVGTIRAERGRVLLTDLRASHGAISVSCGGEFAYTPEGEWKLKLAKLSADRLRPDRDRELFQALPLKLRQSLSTLRLTGPLNVQGDLEFSGVAGDPLKFAAGWNMEVEFQKAQIDSGLKLDNLYGAVTLIGKSDAKGFVCQGELDLDSVDYKEFQFTEVRGPISIDEKQAVFGSLDVLRRKVPKGSRPRHITGKLLGGSIYGDAIVLAGQGSPDYQLTARLVDADLGRYAREMLPGRQAHLSGRVLGEIELQGSGTHTLRGTGALALREADVYELPIMVSMLSILSLKPPDSSAFTESDVEFRIVGDYVQFKQIDFRGDAISLRGSGAMNFNTELQLAFHAVVGRDDVRIPVVDKIVGRASQQLMEIYVTGTLANPETKRKLIPGVQHILEELQGNREKPK